MFRQFHQLFRRTRSRAAVGVIATGALAAGLFALPAQSASALGTYCSYAWPGQVKFVWDGSAGDGLWSTDANWANNLEPNLTHGATGYVCIPTGSTVTLQAGERADLQAFDLAGGATLNLATGSKLYVYGDQATRPSGVRSGATLDLRGTFGGPGRLDLLGLMRWTSTAFGASTIATRDCALGATCGVPVAGPTGYLEVGNSGVIQINDRGVNFEDQYRIVVRGQVQLSNQGYIAADRGTTFELRPKTAASGTGLLQIGNNGGYYEGRTLNGLTTLSTLINGGRISKTAGTGTSVISATYSLTGAGNVRVQAGTLQFPDGTTQSAVVNAGRSYGTGRCISQTFGCIPTTEVGTDVQNGTFQVPSADSNGANVQVYEVAGGPVGTIGASVQLHATGLAATRTAPAVFTLRYDSSILAGKTWQNVIISRRPEGSNVYTVVPNCDAQGRPPVGSVGCVDRRGLATSSRNVLDAGDAPSDPVDVIMVIRTTATSRWVGR